MIALFQFLIILPCCVILYTPCSESHSFSVSAISSLPTVSQGLFLFIFILLLYILRRQSHLHQSFYYYLFLHDSQLSISIPDFSDLWIRISTHPLSSIGISPRHLKFIMFKTVLLYFLFILLTWSSAITPYLSQSPPSQKCPSPTQPMMTN